MKKISSKTYYRNLGNVKKIPEKLQEISSTSFHTKIGSFKKIPEMLGLDGEFHAVQPIAKVRQILVKNCKKSAAKHSTGN